MTTRENIPRIAITRQKVGPRSLPSAGGRWKAKDGGRLNGRHVESQFALGPMMSRSSSFTRPFPVEILT